MELLRGLDSGPYIHKDTRRIQPILCNIRSQKEELRKQEGACLSSTPSFKSLKCLRMEWMSLKQSELLDSGIVSIEAGYPLAQIAAKVSFILHLIYDLYVSFQS